MYSSGCPHPRTLFYLISFNNFYNNSEIYKGIRMWCELVSLGLVRPSGISPLNFFTANQLNSFLRRSIWDRSRSLCCSISARPSTLGMFDSDSILEKIDSFGRRIGILNRFFGIRFLLESILNGDNRNHNGSAMRFRILKLMTFFSGICIYL